MGKKSFCVKKSCVTFFQKDIILKCLSKVVWVEVTTPYENVGGTAITKYLFCFCFINVTTSLLQFFGLNFKVEIIF